VTEGVKLWAGWVWAQPTPEQACHVLSVYGTGTGGYRPGGFTAALLEAMVRADSGNLAKLAMAFPGYASAVYAAKNLDDGVDRLSALVAGGGESGV
jgi:hypothetical protein